MNLFVSTFVNKIDKKGRVSLPSIFRSALPKNSKNEIILSKSLRNDIIDGLSVDRVKEIAKRINNLDFFSEEHEDFTTSIFSEMLPTNLDKEGRFLIPEQLKKFANIKNEVSFIGQGYFFQIVNPSTALDLQKKSRTRLNLNKKTLGKILTGKIDD
jgi:MraZ protein